jgi:selenide,water dikinase
LTDLVLVGAGHAHVEVLRRFARRPVPGARLILVTRTRHTPYSGMLPGLIAGHYRFADAHIDVAALARTAGARLVLAEATGLDVAGRRVLCGDAAVPFDVVSLNVGSRPNADGVPGAAEHAIPVKPIDGFLARFEGVLERVRAGRSRHVVMVGGGAGGVELMLAVAWRLRQEAGMRFTLIAGSNDIVPTFPTGVRTRLRRALGRLDVTVRTGVPVAAVAADGVVLADGAPIAADDVLWTTEAAPAQWLRETGLAVDAGGFGCVDATLRASANIFAAGDMIALGPGAATRSGVYAVRAGPILAANLRAALTGSRLRRYRPQRAALAILSTGGRYAVITRNGVAAEGGWAWWLKDRIDRRFMARFAVSEE